MYRPVIYAADMDLSLTEAEGDLVELCREFATKEIAPRAPAAWEKAECPTDLLRDMGQLGLLGMLIPEEWGGIGMTTVGFVAAMEQIGLADQSVAAAWQAHVTIGSLPLYLFGNDSQRERWLRPLAEGRVLGAFGLTEPDAGSDTRGITTRAERQDGGWLINGAKSFISNAGTDMSFGVTLLARTEPAEDQGPTFGSFVVEKGTPGFTMGPKMRGIGWRGLDTRELYFDDVWVPDEHLIGSQDLGLSQFLGTLEVGRISIAALSLSLTQAVLTMATEYARQRNQFRQVHLQVSGRPVQAGRHGDRIGGGPMAHVSRRLPAGHRAALSQRGIDGETEGEPGGHPGRVRGGPDPRGNRLHARVPGGPFLLRFEGAGDRGRDQRDPAHRHRPYVGVLSPCGNGGWISNPYPVYGAE